MKEHKLVLSVGLKGGVGKTTVAINTARALKRRGHSVGILDLDYRTPNVPVAMNDDYSELDHSFDGDMLVPPLIEGIKVMSMQYIWPAHKCVQVEDADAMDDVLNLLTPGVIDWGELDYLVLDTPPTSTGVVRVALEATNVQGALIVTHASRVSRMDTIRTIDLFAEKQVPIIGLICNQSIDVNGEFRYDLSIQDIIEVAERYGIKYLETIPHSRGDLKPFFDVIADAVVLGKTTTLKIPEVRQEAWSKLMLLSKRLSASKSESS